MRRNKLKVLSSLAILGIAGLGLAACNNNTGSGTTPSPTPTPTENGGGATTTPTPTPVPTTPSQTTTTTPNQSSTTNTPAQKVVKSISISGGKTLYLVGEEFSFDGVVVTKTYNDETQETATADEVTYKIYSDEDGTKEATSIATAGTYYVYVTCGGKDNYYAITVQEKQQTIHEFFDAAILTASQSVTETIDVYEKNGNKISATASADRIIKIDSSVKTVDGINFTQRINTQGQTLKGTETISVDSNGKLTNPRGICITVAHDSTLKLYVNSSSGDYKRIFGITNNADYTKTTIIDGNLKGLEFEVKAGTYYLYTDATTDDSQGIKAGGWYLYGADISYNVPKSSVTYSEIKVDASNAKTDFNKGDEFVTTGLVVKGLNNYGVWDVLDAADYTITNEDGSAVDLTTVGKKTLKVTAKDHSDTYDIQVINPNATVESIVVKEEPKVVYKKGEEISLSGLTITSTDSDSLTQDIAYDAEKITYKVLKGETDVTSQFTTLTKGTYTVELTYASKTATYSIKMLEVKEGKFEYDNYAPIGGASYSSKLIISYTDGTDADYSKYNDTILSTAEGYSTKFYSDATHEHELNLTDAFVEEKDVYATFNYETYSKNDAEIKVRLFESYSTSNLTKGTDYKEQELFDSTLIKVTAGSKAQAISNVDQIQIKLDNGKNIKFEVKEKAIVRFIVNANGDNKTYSILASNGEKLAGAKLNKNKNENYVIELELEAGTYTLESTGGICFAGVTAIKPE